MPNVPFLGAAKYQVNPVRVAVDVHLFLYLAIPSRPDSESYQIAFEISPEKMIDDTKFTIGDITISVEGDFQLNALEIPSAYRPFLQNGKTDITLRLHEKNLLPKSGKKIFDSPPIWSLYRNNGTSILRIFEKIPGYGRTLVLAQNIENSDLYFDDPTSKYCNPFYGPTVELLMMNYLAQGRGVIIHGCGIKQDDRGLLFVGESGAGKTTIARIWSQESDVEVLSDDRTIVRKKDDHFVMYGTPWHGEGKFGSPGSVKLDQMFFINHAGENSILESNKAHSVTQLLQCSFPTFWDAAGMEYSMDVFSDLAATIPCWMLSFKPDGSIIEFIDNLL